MHKYKIYPCIMGHTDVYLCNIKRRKCFRDLRKLAIMLDMAFMDMIQIQKNRMEIWS